MRARAVRLATFGLIILGVSGLTVQGAGLSRAVQPPMTEAELLEIAVSASDAVILGTVLGIHDSVHVTKGGGTLREGRYLILSDVIALKGDVGGAEVMVLASAFGKTATVIQKSLGRSYGRGIFFVLRTPSGWLLNFNWAPEVLPLRKGGNAESSDGTTARRLAVNRTAWTLSRRMSSPVRLRIQP